tara:strand:- start:164 stop:334 length:171 start_codon:yes stop_codon:yes gene_type:complete
MIKFSIPILSYIFLQILGSLVLAIWIVEGKSWVFIKNIQSTILLVAPLNSDKNEKN